MREIKFRGKSIETGEWIYGDIQQFEDRIYICNHCTGHGYIKVCPKTVGQFINAYDKKKAEIYHGDLFEDSTGVSIVVWNDKYASWCLRRKGWFYDHFFGEAVDPQDGEIIGNIHENATGDV